MYGDVLFSPTWRIIPAIPPRSNGFLHDFVAASFSSLSHYPRPSKTLTPIVLLHSHWPSASRVHKVLDIAQSVGYNGHVDQSESTGACLSLGSYQSGQMGLTVNQLSSTSGVRIPHCPPASRRSQALGAVCLCPWRLIEGLALV
jgi:hypothetical protein